MTGAARSLLARLPGCARMGAEALDALASAARPMRFASGAVLLGEGQPVPDWYCVVESGAVHVTRIDLEGDEILQYLGAGDVLDPGSPGSLAPWSVRAVEETRCLLVPQSVVSEQRAGRGELMIGSGGDLALFVRRVRDLVERSPVTCSPATPVAQAARLMSERGVGSVADEALARPDAQVVDVPPRHLQQRVESRVLTLDGEQRRGHDGRSRGARVEPGRQDAGSEVAIGDDTLWPAVPLEPRPAGAAGCPPGARRP